MVKQQSKMSNGSYYNYLLPLIFIFLLIAGCSLDAGRDNPLDPGSSAYNEPGAKLSGKIIKYYTQQPLSGVYVFLSPIEKGTISQIDGSYSFEDLNADIYTVELEYPGYNAPPTYVEIPATGTVVQNITMNALPTFDSVSVTSQRIRTDIWSGEHYFQIAIYAEARDSDGDSELNDSALVSWGIGYSQMDTLNRIGTLPSQAVAYSVVLKEEDFPQGEIEEMMGLPFKILVNDIHNDTMVSESVQLSRYIDTAIQSRYPDANYGSEYGIDSTGKPEFEWWIPIGIVFDYKYKLKLYKEATRELVFTETIYDTSSFISINNTLITYIYNVQNPENLLAVGYYFWTIQFEDDFGNYSRSEEKPFEEQY